MGKGFLVTAGVQQICRASISINVAGDLGPACFAITLFRHQINTIAQYGSSGSF